MNELGVTCLTLSERVELEKLQFEHGLIGIAVTIGVLALVVALLFLVFWLFG
ncbi:hypothetical protein [Vibrio diazotrophicus]|uniref:hypothetical protein n=1 Tax=Vibrio diazotrophicus TaxID=685 RepID=UPI003D2F99D8